MASAHTDADGEYQLRLLPGSYLIRAKAGYPAGQGDQAVTLAAGQRLTVNFTLDTGIR